MAELYKGEDDGYASKTYYFWSRILQLPFLGRIREKQRLLRALSANQGNLVCLLGRRRLGKSRLLREVLKDLPAVYVVGDVQEAALQRSTVAREISRLLPGFASVQYPSWDALLERWWGHAPSGAVLALDEFSAFVRASPELPSVLQRWIDRASTPARHLALCGSSQRLLLGLLMDATAPLYGRAREVIQLGPLEIGYLPVALHTSTAEAAVTAWAVWGGVPRYWELAAEYAEHWEAVGDLVLDSMGVLHHEPQRLLLDDRRETAQAASLLAVVGQGCHRLSEIGARLGHPATALTRPLARLLEMGLLRREIPWGDEERNSKRSLYQIADPLLSFWYRLVEPERSRLAVGQLEGVRGEIQRKWPEFLGGVWETLARDSVARLSIGGESWLPARRWWGAGIDHRPLEIDMVSQHASDPTRVLVGEAKLSAKSAEIPRLIAELEGRASRCPLLVGKTVETRLWVLGGVDDPRLCMRGEDVVGNCSG